MNATQEVRDPEALREILYELILRVAPDLTRDDLSGDVDLRYDLGLDSIDSLNIATGIAERIGFEIPEIDRGGLNTVDSLVRYISKHFGEAG